MNQVPILLISDAPDQSSGLSRICRDLATLLTNTQEFRVATLGLGGRGAVDFPWQQYQMYHNEFGERSLPYVWDNFARDMPGIIFTIFDLSRLMWLAKPEYAEDDWLKEWLLDARRRKLRLWSYVPVDSTGPHNRLTTYSREVLLGIDRIIAYSPWGMGIIRNTIGEEEAVRRGLDWCPHGINTRTFAPRPISNNVTSVNTCTRVDALSGNAQRLEPKSMIVDDGEHEDNALASSSTTHVQSEGYDDTRVAAGVDINIGGDVNRGVAGIVDKTDRERRTEEEGIIASAAREAIVDIEPQGGVAEVASVGGIGDLEHQPWCGSRRSTGLESNAGTCTCRIVERLVEGTVGANPRIVSGNGRDSSTAEPTQSSNKGRDAGSTPTLPPKLIGIVMTNQARKDWGLAAATCAGIVERLKGEVQFWWHTQLRHHVWNLDALIADFQLDEYVEVTTQPVSDGWLAEQYRRCDLTLLPSLGEGFGLPIFESLACGVPVIHGDYAGGASIMSTCGLSRYLVQPVAWRLEGQHNCLRPVYEPADWVNAACDVLAIKPDVEWLAGRVAHLSWMKLGHVWQRWFREGLGDA